MPLGTTHIVDFKKFIGSSESLPTDFHITFGTVESEIIVQYRDFLKQVVALVGLSKDYTLTVIPYEEFKGKIGIDLPFVSEYVALVQSSDADQYIDPLQKITQKVIVQLHPTIICWGEGNFIQPKHKPLFEQPTEVSQKEVTERVITEIQLPYWLDKCIYSTLKADYQPSFNRFSFNLDLSQDESKVYLGTYFPRSFAENFFIFQALLKDKTLVDNLMTKASLKILDFGCGSGGATLGLLQAIEDNVAHHFDITIFGVDGNFSSLRLFERIVDVYNSRNKNHIDLKIQHSAVTSFSDLSDTLRLLGSDFDFIITSKAMGEFERGQIIGENSYEQFACSCAPLLSESGSMLILDVTTMDTSSNLFLPQLMNVGINRFIFNNNSNFKSIAPCTGIQPTGWCKQKCFYKKEIYVSHSHKKRDLSKYAFRLITRKAVDIDNTHINQLFANKQCLYN